MRDFEFIHSTEDVLGVLRLAAKNGLTIAHDHPSIIPTVDVVTPEDICQFNRGTFLLYHQNWVFGELQFDKILSGHNAGRYFLNPNTNFISLTLSFSGERKEGDIVRLGSGFLSCPTNWYRPNDHTVHPAPSDVKAVFNSLRKRIDTNVRAGGGVHSYALLEGARSKLFAAAVMPPFDYVEWPPTPS